MDPAIWLLTPLYSVICPNYFFGSIKLVVDSCQGSLVSSIPVSVVLLIE